MESREVRTLGQFVDQEGILASLAEMIGHIHAHSTRGAIELGRRQRLRVSCGTCSAPKACCHSLVVARLYEGVLAAAQLRRDGRDTPELRAELAAKAAAMEAAGPEDWRAPCVFLDAKERCTIYEARPVPCGALYVYSPPAACADRQGQVTAYVAHAENDMALQLEEQFRERLALRKKVGRRYVGTLPRMTLVALEAWDRTDFRDYLRQLTWPSDEDVARWSRR
jgi:Fe-S-cluster containining protein